jgi:hypothetical protein
MGSPDQISGEYEHHENGVREIYLPEGGSVKVSEAETVVIEDILNGEVEEVNTPDKTVEQIYELPEESIVYVPEGAFLEYFDPASETSAAYGPFDSEAVMEESGNALT